MIVSPRKPEGIEERKAYIVGGGIAGLSAAAFLVRDAQMPGGNIAVYDQLPVFGSIPSFYEEGRTVLDETRECNKNWESDSKHRLCEQGFQPP